MIGSYEKLLVQGNGFLPSQNVLNLSESSHPLLLNFLRTWGVFNNSTIYKGWLDLHAPPKVGYHGYRHPFCFRKQQDPFDRLPSAPPCKPQELRSRWTQATPSKVPPTYLGSSLKRRPLCFVLWQLVLAGAWRCRLSPVHFLKSSC